jgi:hypothetical protein
MRIRNQSRRFIGFASSSIIAVGTQAYASSNLTVVSVYDTSITSLPNAAAIENSIGADITRLESQVTTVAPVTVKIDFENSNSGLGSSLVPQIDLNYSTYLTDLEANPNKSATQIAAIATMPTGPNTGINGATQVLLTAANLAAIGDTADASSIVSGNGGLNATVSLNLSIINATRPDSNPDNYDLQSVAGHEIDEVLGIGGNGSTLFQEGATPPTSLPTDVSGLDLFRYSSSGTRSFTYNPATSAYFSVDGGLTNLVYFNQQNGADGSDFGDWGNPAGTQDGNTPAQLQDAFGTPGGTPDLGTNELTALSVVGYNLTSAVPEPASCSLLAIAAMGMLARRRRSTAN